MAGIEGLDQKRRAPIMRDTPEKALVRRLHAKVCNIKGVNGVGYGLNDTLVVFLEHEDERTKLPTEFEGHRIEIHLIGKIIAY